MSSVAENQRVNFASIKNPFPYPDFLEVQLKSFRDFLQLDTPPEKRKKEGLYKVFAENFPIADTRNNFVLEFLDYYIDPPRYTIDECISRGLTYSVPLKAKLKLYCTDPDHEDFDTVIQDVYLGPIPYMTERGTFVINGAERVVVSQLHRSPGVFFGQSIHANGTKLYSARIIPFKGSWIEFATDINNVMYAYIDRKKKLPVTTLLRAIGFESDKDILEIFNLAEEVKVSKANLKKLGITVKFDDADNRKPGWKFANYELKGVPVRLAMGGRDLENNTIEVMRRDTLEKETVSCDGIENYVQNLLEDIQKNIYQKALKHREEHTITVDTYDEFKEKIEQGYFIMAHWDGTPETEERIKNETKATIRCLPLEGDMTPGKCMVTGKPSARRVLFARAY